MISPVGRRTDYCKIVAQLSSLKKVFYGTFAVVTMHYAGCRLPSGYNLRFIAPAVGVLTIGETVSGSQWQDRSGERLYSDKNSTAYVRLSLSLGRGIEYC